MPDMWSKILWIYGLAAVVSLVIAALIKLIVVILGGKEQAASAVAHEQPAPALPGFDIAADHVTAISAAVYAVLGSHRILHIEESRGRRGWLAEGRHAQHTSHGVGHHPKH